MKFGLFDNSDEAGSRIDDAFERGLLLDTDGAIQTTTA
jgi:hypothetical protein